MSNRNIQYKERGILLNIVLGYTIINLIEAIFNMSNFNNTYKMLYDPIPSWLFPSALIADILEVIGVYGIIKWKKWGAYSILASLVLAFFSCFFVTQHLLEIIIASSIISFIVIWAIFSKWKDFS